MYGENIPEERNYHEDGISGRIVEEWCLKCFLDGERERDNRTELALLVSLIAAVVKCAKITRAWQLDPNTSSSSSSPWEPACQELRKRRARFNWALKLHSHLVLWLLSGTPHTFTPSLFLTHSLTHVFIQAPVYFCVYTTGKKNRLFSGCLTKEKLFCTVSLWNSFAKYSS